jgi:hypothetical protein
MVPLDQAVDLSPFDVEPARTGSKHRACPFRNPSESLTSLHG